MIGLPAGLMPDLTGALVAGGRSSRFGRDKALACLGGRTLLERAAASLEGCGLRLLVAPPGRYALSGWEAVPDTRPGEGPLAGLEAALAAVTARRGAGWVALCGVDQPALTPAYWAALWEAGHVPGVRAGVLAVQARDPQGRAQPLAALYHTALLPGVTALLDAGERRLRLAAPPEATVTVAGLPRQLFANVNRPEDLLALERLLAAGESA